MMHYIALHWYSVIPKNESMNKFVVVLPLHGVNTLVEVVYAHRRFILF